MKKVIFLFSVSIFTLIFSCNNGKGENKVQKGSTTTSIFSPNDSLFKDTSKNNMIATKTLAISDTIYDKDIVIDTIIDNYHISYSIKDNNSVIACKYYGEVTGKTRIAYFADRSVHLDVKKQGKSILQNKKINKEMFGIFDKYGDINEYKLNWLDIYAIENNHITFQLYMCKPDSDICYLFYIHVNDFGISSVEWIDEGEMGE